MPRRRVGRWRRSECAGLCRSRHRPATAPVRVRDPAGGGPGAGEAPGADAPRSAPRQPAGLHPQVAEVLRAQPIEPAGPNTSTSPPHGRLRSAAPGLAGGPCAPPAAPRVAQLIRIKPALTTENTNRWTYIPWIDLARSRACSYSASRDEVWSDAVALPSSSFDDISFTSSTSLASWSDWRQGRAPRPTRAARQGPLGGARYVGPRGWGRRVGALAGQAGLGLGRRQALIGGPQVGQHVLCVEQTSPSQRAGLAGWAGGRVPRGSRLGSWSQQRSHGPCGAQGRRT